MTEHVTVAVVARPAAVRGGAWVVYRWELIKLTRQAKALEPYAVRQADRDRSPL